MCMFWAPQSLETSCHTICGILGSSVRIQQFCQWAVIMPDLPPKTDSTILTGESHLPHWCIISFLIRYFNIYWLDVATCKPFPANVVNLKHSAELSRVSAFLVRDFLLSLLLWLICRQNNPSVCSFCFHIFNLLQVLVNHSELCGQIA